MSSVGVNRVMLKDNVVNCRTIGLMCRIIGVVVVLVAFCKDNVYLYRIIFNHCRCYGYTEIHVSIVLLVRRNTPMVPLEKYWKLWQTEGLFVQLWGFRRHFVKIVCVFSQEYSFVSSIIGALSRESGTPRSRNLKFRKGHPWTLRIHLEFVKGTYYLYTPCKRRLGPEHVFSSWAMFVFVGFWLFLLFVNKTGNRLIRNCNAWPHNSEALPLTY